jgi:hypothetical protein
MAITISGNGIVEGNLANGAVTNTKLATGIDATKLGDGTVTSAELQYINSLSSNAQTQISAAGGLTSKVVTGTYDMSTTGSFAITSVGFQPTACLCFLHKDSNPAASWGFASTTVTDDGNIHDYHNVGANYMNSAWILWTLYTSGSDIAKGAVASYDADGATFTKSKTGSPTGTAYYTFLLMK